MPSFFKNIQKKYIVSLFLILVSAVSIPLFVQSTSKTKQLSSRAMQEIAKEVNIDNYTYITPLDIQEQIETFTIDGSVTLFAKDAFLRVILIDKNDSEYLVYETNTSMTDQIQFEIQNECEETCSLNKISASRLRIEGKSSAFNQTKINSSTQNISSLMKLASKPAENKTEKNRMKILQLNETIKKKGLKWTAGETEISNLTYEEKKKLFRNKDGSPVTTLPNLQGFEYYVGGVFEIQGTEAGPPPPSQTPTYMPTNIPTAIPSVAPIYSSLVEQWDWRNRHGQNWITPVKNQLGCGSCWAFASVGVTESLINLYYNQILNVDLSEQDSVCRHSGSCVNGGFYSDTFNELRSEGLVTEACYPYTGTETCSGKCVNYASQLWKIENTSYINVWPFDPEVTKRTLITKGPIPFTISSWWHIMTLVGYDKDQYSGQTIWIVKNSWGTSWGEGGFGKVIVPQNDTYSTAYIEHPYLDSNPNLYSISCTDNDKDNYCNWGITSDKPSTCPASCSGKKDCDDSNPNIGTFVEGSYSCARIQIVTPTPTAVPVLINKNPVITTSVLPSVRFKRYTELTINGYDLNNYDKLSMVISGLPVGLTNKGCRSTILSDKVSISCTVSGSTTRNGSYSIRIKLSDDKGGSVSKAVPLTVLSY